MARKITTVIIYLLLLVASYFTVTKHYTITTTKDNEVLFTIESAVLDQFDQEGLNLNRIYAKNAVVYSNGDLTFNDVQAAIYNKKAHRIWQLIANRVEKKANHLYLQDGIKLTSLLNNQLTSSYHITGLASLNLETNVFKSNSPVFFKIGGLSYTAQSMTGDLNNNMFTFNGDIEGVFDAK